MVHFPALPSWPYVFRPGYGGITRRGLPHSDIPGSKLVCSSPRLFAAYCVLHRLLAPRHSPYALSSLTTGSIDNFRPQMCRLPEGNRQSAISNHQCLPTLTKHCCVCGSEKLPFAGYSVVKDQPGELCSTRTPSTRSLVGTPRSPLRSRGRLTRVRRLSPLTHRARRNSQTLESTTIRTLTNSLHSRTRCLAAFAFREGWWRIPGSNR
jgi:hypothetical protein